MKKKITVIFIALAMLAVSAFGALTAFAEEPFEDILAIDFEDHYDFTIMNEGLDVPSHEMSRMQIRRSDGDTHLQINADNIIDNNYGYVIYKLAADKGYAFETLVMTANGRIEYFAGTGSVDFKLSVSTDADEYTAIVDQNLTAGKGIAKPFTWDFTEQAEGSPVVYVKLEIRFNAQIDGYEHDWIRFSFINFDGSQYPAETEYSVTYDYTVENEGRDIYGADTSDMVIRETADADIQGKFLQVDPENKQKTGFVVYKLEPEYDGYFLNLTMSGDGRIAYLENDGGKAVLRLSVKTSAEGEYADVAGFEGGKDVANENNQAPFSWPLSNAANAKVVYVKLEIELLTDKTYAHDWIRLAQISFTGTQLYNPPEDDGREKHSVTYNSGAEDASGRIPVQKDVAEGDTFELPRNSFARTGYIFVAWADQYDTLYLENQSVVMGTEDLVFSAEWEAIKYQFNYIVKEGYSGDAPLNLKLTMGQTTVLPENPFTYPGYVFVGWKIGSRLFYPGDTYTMEAVPGSGVAVDAYWSTGKAGNAIELGAHLEGTLGDEFYVNYTTTSEGFASLIYDSFNTHIAVSKNEPTFTVMAPTPYNTDDYPLGFDKYYCNYVIYKLALPEDVTFDELVFSFAGRVANYEPSSATRLQILCSGDGENYNLVEQKIGIFENAGLKTSYRIDLTAAAKGKNVIYIKLDTEMTNVNDYAYDWVAFTAVQFEGVVDLGNGGDPGGNECPCPEGCECDEDCPCRTGGECEWKDPGNGGGDNTTGCKGSVTAGAEVLLPLIGFALAVRKRRK